MAKKKVYAIKEGFDFSKNERVQNHLGKAKSLPALQSSPPGWGTSFCPHCARSIKPWTRQKAPKPLQKKFLHIAALVTALAVIASCA